MRHGTSLQQIIRFYFQFEGFLRADLNCSDSFFNSASKKSIAIVRAST